ncbi:hypothetical protein K0M31_014613 [Melipona bicolor]|uniref:Uncharacterized protein n=1 Tax=Melipona bicolor TaxID=60889 RepID=A0AA40KG07_9HYME|nr:hypothetical protein K0M31_014613 [Melipona bicolor]
MIVRVHRSPPIPIASKGGIYCWRRTASPGSPATFPILKRVRSASNVPNRSEAKRATFSSGVDDGVHLPNNRVPLTITIASNGELVPSHWVVSPPSTFATNVDGYRLPQLD